MSAGTQRWFPAIARWSAKFNADPKLIDAIMQCESGGNPNAVGKKNNNGTTDLGLMQLNPKGALASWTANGHPPRDPMNPEHALEVACWFVGKMIPAWLREYALPVTQRNVIVAYNAGVGALLPGRSVPATTVQYLAKVQARYAASTFAAEATAAAPVTTPRSGQTSPVTVRLLGGLSVAASALWGLLRFFMKSD